MGHVPIQSITHLIDRSYCYFANGCSVGHTSLPEINHMCWFCTFLGASQIKGFRPLLEKTFPSIYQIFRASQNTNRWRIIDTIFAKSQPLDARVMFFFS